MTATPRHCQQPDIAMKCRLLLVPGVIATLLAAAWAGNIGVIAVTYGIYAGGGTSGTLQCVYRSPADATHATTWQMKRVGSNVWPPAIPVDSPAVRVSTGGAAYWDYNVHFISSAGNVAPADTTVRVFRNQAAITTVSYP